MDDQAGADSLRPKYQRVVLKLSGEGFGHPGKSGISIDETLSIARQAQARRAARRAAGHRRRRPATSSAAPSSAPAARSSRKRTAHYMGMLATVLNGLALQDALESLNCETRLHDRHPHGERGRAVHPPPGHRAIWKRAASSSWPAAPAIRSSPPTPPPPCAPASWRPTSCSRPRASTASTATTRSEPARHAL